MCPAQPRRARAWIPLAIVVHAGCAGPAAAPGAGVPPTHPFLADAPWPIAHQSPWAQASSGLPVMEAPDEAEVELLQTGLVSITHATSAPYPDGSTVLWASSPAAVHKILRDGPLEVVATLRRSGGLSNLIAGAYTFVDDQGRLFASEAERIARYEDADPTDARSAIVAGPVLELPYPQPEEAIVGLALTWDGFVAFVTSTGRVGVATRDLELVDQRELGDGLTVSNDLLADETGGLIVVTDRMLHRVAWDGERLSVEAADGAWAVPYAVDEGVSAGRLGAGSGSTPTLLGVPGGERLVAITDGQALMHVALFWADAIPEDWQGLGEGRDRRLAGERAVTFGDAGATRSISEQSIAASGWRLAVVSNDYGDAGAGKGPVLAGVAPLGVEQLAWDPVTRTLATTWVRRDVSCPNGIPAVSRASDVFVCLGRRGLTWTFELLDWQDGSDRGHVVLGDDEGFNSVYAATEIGPDGELLSGTLTGMVRARPAR